MSRQRRCLVSITILTMNRWELISNEVETLEEPRQQDWGHKTLFFKDPEGNILEIYADI